MAGPNLVRDVFALDRRPRAGNKEDEEKNPDDAERGARRTCDDISAGIADESRERLVEMSTLPHAMNPSQGHAARQAIYCASFASHDLCASRQSARRGLKIGRFARCRTEAACLSGG